MSESYEDILKGVESPEPGEGKENLIDRVRVDDYEDDLINIINSEVVYVPTGDVCLIEENNASYELFVQGHRLPKKWEKEEDQQKAA